MRTILFTLLIVLIVFVTRHVYSEEAIKVVMLNSFELNFIRPVKITTGIVRTHFLLLPDSGDKLLLPDSEDALLKIHYSQ
jgi:hypothetical protein